MKGLCYSFKKSVILSARVRLTRNVLSLPASKTPQPARETAQLTGWALLPAVLLGKNVCETWRWFGQKLVTQLHFSAFLAAHTPPPFFSSSLQHPPPDPWHRACPVRFFRVCVSKPIYFLMEWHTHPIIMPSEIKQAQFKEPSCVQEPTGLPCSKCSKNTDIPCSLQVFLEVPRKAEGTSISCLEEGIWWLRQQVS